MNAFSPVTGTETISDLQTEELWGEVHVVVSLCPVKMGTSAAVTEEAGYRRLRCLSQ